MADNEEKFQTFMTLTECTDYGAAIEYLERNEWDVERAVDEYISTHEYRNEQDNQPASNDDAAIDVEDDIVDVNPPGFTYQDIRGPGYSYHSEQHFYGSNQDMNQPEDLGNRQTQQPESLLGGAMGMLHNFGNQFSNILGGGFPPMPRPQPTYENYNMPSYDSPMNQDDNSSSGNYFIKKFREKNGMSINLPNFVDGTINEVLEESKRLQRPIFLYVHNHQGDSWSIVDQTVIGHELVLEIAAKFIWYGVNVNHQQGSELVNNYGISGAPYMAILQVDWNGSMQIIGSLFAEEINVPQFFEMVQPGLETLKSHFGEDTEIPEFFPEDSQLQAAETEELKEQILGHFDGREATGFIEPRRREPQIDPNTGIPFGMTEKQYQDKLLKEEQKKELEAAMQADRIKLQAHKEEEEKKKRDKLEEVKRQEAKEQETKLKKFKAQQIKESLPDEPSEDNSNAWTVQFRLPDGTRTIQRRFLKTDKIKLLYDYIHSLGEENGFEHIANNFDIIQNFPKKLFDDQDKTLDEEGLFPRWKLYIKEHSYSSQSH